MNLDSPDVTELMERIRREGQAQRRNGDSPGEPTRLELPALAAPLPPPPPPAPARPFAAGAGTNAVPIWEVVADLAARARRKITVGTWLPVWLRPLARNQGGFNGIVLEAIERLGQSQREWQERMQEQLQDQLAALRADFQAQQAWLEGLVRARESDLGWMRAVEPCLQRALTESEGHRLRAEQGESRVEAHLAEIEEQSRYARSDLDQLSVRTGYHETHAAGLDERLSFLQSQADAQTGHSHAQAEHLERVNEHVNHLQSHVDEQTGRLREQAEEQIARLREQAERGNGLSTRLDQMNEHLRDLQRHAEGQDGRAAQVDGRLDHLVQRVDQFGDPLGELRKLGAGQHQHNEQLARHLGELQRQTDSQSQHNERVAQHLGNLQRQNDAQDADLRRAESWQGNLEATVHRLDERQIADAVSLKNQVALLGRLLQRQLEPAAERSDHGSTDAPAPPGSPLREYREHELDPFYLAFENRFRGTRETIKEQATVHLAVLEAARERGASSPVLDLGCGRGEWLELLRERGFTAAGVDLNESMIEQCRERGLEVASADVMEYLQGLPDASRGAITAFHLIEHLPFRVLVRFVQECLRVLQPNGVVIFETPNPDNIVVGATEFWGDFTHQRPVLPASVAFLAEQTGFVDVRVVPLHPVPEAPDPNPEPHSAVWDRVHGLLYGPRDYALVAAKACTS